MDVRSVRSCFDLLQFVKIDKRFCGFAVNDVPLLFVHQAVGTLLADAAQAETTRL